MQPSSKFRRALAALVALGLTLPGGARAAEGSPQAKAARPLPATGIEDVALMAGGCLQGRVVDRTGAAVVNAAVSLQFAGSDATLETKTDVQGRFVIAELVGGPYQICAAGGGGLFRLWAENSGPRRPGRASSSSPARVPRTANGWPGGRGPIC